MMTSDNPENVRLFRGVGPLLAFTYIFCLTYSELLVTVTKRLDDVTFIWCDHDLVFCLGCSVVLLIVVVPSL